MYHVPSKMHAMSETIYWEAAGDFRYRWNNYKSNSRKFDRKESCLQEHLYRHFSSSDHKRYLNDVSVTLINKTDGSDPKKWEDYHMKTLKTIKA